MKKFPETNIIYLYDLPHKSYTSTQLAKVIKEQTGYNLEHMPQVRRDPGKPFYTAVIKIDNAEKFHEVASKLRFFTLEGKPCRALPYNSELLGSNVTRLNTQNLFVRKIPKTEQSQSLEEHFKQYGDIISSKVSLNEDHSSRGYGFVCFKDPESCSRALSESSKRDDIIGVKFEPKSKAEFRKVYNNIFVKNMPAEWTEVEVKKAFEPFGNISSCFMGKHIQGPFAFICYSSKDASDREYGPKCAAKAVAAMDTVNGLYVKPALKKQEREKELAHETLKYKNSKKRCNLYVKNFEPATTEEDLKQLFAPFGEIESLKLFSQKDNKMPFAFVCFKTPDTASQVKNAQLQLNGRPLYINHYEMKQQRDLQNESNKDKQDFQRYQAENVQQVDFQNYDQITSLLRLLMSTVQSKQTAPGPNMRSHSQGGPMNNQYQPHNQGGHYQNNRPHYQVNRDQQHRRGGNPNPQMSGGRADHMQQQQQQHIRQHNPMPAAMPSAMPQPMPTAMPAAMPGAPAQNMLQFTPSNDPMSAEFYAKTMPIYAAITEINPSYKQTVGSTIFEFVTKMVGNTNAPKITGMLIDLPIIEIQRFVTNFDLLAQRVNQAQTLLQQQAQTAAQSQ
jgi:RNA recognition motif-containing protein